MDRYNRWSTIAAGALAGVLLGTVAYIVLPSQSEVIPANPSPPEVTEVTVDIQTEILTAISVTAPASTVVHTVCDDFDNDLWFWDMYDERLGQMRGPAYQNEADALFLSMGDEVTSFCPNHQDRLPTELLVPSVLLPGESD